MESYKQRMQKEYLELKERADKLNRMINDYYFGELGFKLNFPIKLLESQYYVMCSYLKILEQRAEIENVTLNEKIYMVVIPVGDNLYTTLIKRTDGTVVMADRNYISLKKLKEHNLNIPGGLTEKDIKESSVSWAWLFAEEITK